MNNWKTLMIFNFPTEADAAQRILKSNGISTMLDVIFMTETYELYHLINCEKLLVSEENYNRGLQILRNSGFNQTKELIDGSFFEINQTES